MERHGTHFTSVPPVCPGSGECLLCKEAGSESLSERFHSPVVAMAVARVNEKLVLVAHPETGKHPDGRCFRVEKVGVCMDRRITR